MGCPGRAAGLSTGARLGPNSTPMTDLQSYRPNVGVVLFHPDGRVWFGRRARTPGPHNWQFPQGGVDAGEELEAAARRELAEETGVVAATLLEIGRASC